MKQKEIHDLTEDFNNFQNKVLETTFSAVNDKQAEVNLWKKRTAKLAAQFKVCWECGSQKDWIPETMTCRQCQKCSTNYENANS